MNAGPLDESCEARFRVIASACAAEIDVALAVFLDSDDPAGPHKTRVALRRLTTALDAFAPILRRRLGFKLKARAKMLFRELGVVRDSDVHLLSAPERKKDDKWVGRNLRLRKKVRANIRKSGMVGFSQELRAVVLVDDLMLRTSEGSITRRMSPVSDFASEVLVAAWDRCIAFGPSVQAIPLLERHEFRKEIKRLRYLLEFLGAHAHVVPDAMFIWNLREMQDLLGELNDFAVALQIEGRPHPRCLLHHVAVALDRAEFVWSRIFAVQFGNQPTRSP